MRPSLGLIFFRAVDGMASITTPLRLLRAEGEGFVRARALMETKEIRVAAAFTLTGLLPQAMLLHVSTEVINATAGLLRDRDESHFVGLA